jgi:hypothetical protein
MAPSVTTAHQAARTSLHEKVATFIHGYPSLKPLDTFFTSAVLCAETVAHPSSRIGLERKLCQVTLVLSQYLWSRFWCTSES